jgi:hypothetical protein
MREKKGRMGGNTRRGRNIADNFCHDGDDIFPGNKIH